MKLVIDFSTGKSVSAKASMSPVIKHVLDTPVGAEALRKFVMERIHDRDPSRRFRLEDLV